MNSWILGAALTASEAEGVAPTAEWRRWIDREKAPVAEEGSGFRESWRDDLIQLSRLGISELMITLEWARLWPTPDRVDHGEIEFRRDLLGEISALGITPWVCLVDGSLPGWFADDEGGFTDDHARQLLWPRHVDWVGETFGDLVGGWVPQREPMQWAMWGHLLGVTPPGKARRRDAMSAARAGLDADLQAWRLLAGSAPVATHHTARTFHPEPENPQARPHANWLDETFHQQWLRSMSDGPAREAFDRVIVQLRPAVQIDGEGAWSPHGSEPILETQLESLARVVDHAGDRDIVAAGDLVGVPDDGDAQPHHLRSVLEGVRSVGVDGWWQTSAIDGWHWLGGFEVEPGVIDRDRNDRAVTDVLRQAASNPGTTS